MKKIFLRAVVLLLVLSLALSAFASCGEIGKQDNDAQSEKEEVNDSEKTSDDEGASDDTTSDDEGASDDNTSDDNTSDDNEIGTEGLAYKLLDNDTYEVSAGSAKEATEIVIPSKYNGKPVTSIGSHAFDDCTGLTSIDIPDSVTSIGSYAFEGCTGLTSVTIGNGVESIGSSAFHETAYYNNESNWENGVLYIGKYLIGAKDDISGDYSVKEGTKIIASYAFEDCDGLTSIDIPDSVKSIGGAAFSGCDGLTSITVDENNDAYKSIDGNLYSKDGKTFVQYAIGKTDASFAIPDSVTSIGSSAFAYCDGLTSVTIGNGVESIGMHVFTECTGLTSIDIPDSVKSIGYCAFAYCTGLTSVTIGNGVESIGPSAFRDCTGLTSIDIPDSVTSIGYSAFSSCTGLTSIDIPDSVKSIDSYVFENCTNLMSVTIGNGVESIDSSAFSETAYYNNESSWENGVLYIGKYLIDAKYDISGDYSVKEGTKIIASEAFDDRDGLTSIDIPDSVKSIGDFAFQKCNGLTSIKFRGTEAEWNAIEKGADWNYRVPESCQIIFNYTGE